MTERLIDGYRLINIDVDSKANMPFTWPLVACLNLINALLDVSSQILGDFRFYCLRIFRILLVVVPNTSLTELDVKTDTRSPLFAASKDGRNTVTGTTRQMTSTPNVLMQMSSHHMKHTGARIVYSSNSSCTHTPSYILFFDNLPTYQTHLPGSAKPSALRVVNIAAEMGDRSFFEVARLLHDLKFNSLKGKLRQLFSFHEYRLELVKVGKPRYNVSAVYSYLLIGSYRLKMIKPSFVGA